MHKGFLIWASALGALAVTLGAFGAHKLKELVPAETVSTFQTGVTYQFYHVFALMAVGILYKEFPTKLLTWSGRLFITGIVLFSGSLYILTAVKAAGASTYNWVGAITPLGGLCFILGWIFIFPGCNRKV